MFRAAPGKVELTGSLDSVSQNRALSQCFKSSKSSASFKAILTTAGLVLWAVAKLGPQAKLLTARPMP